MKRRLATTMAIGLAALGAALPLTASATKLDPTAKATFKGPIKVKKGSKATLTVRYTCSKGTVLWISAKEVANGSKDKRLEKDGSSKTASGWWESHRNAITCNGKSHTHTFTVDRVEKGSKGKLKPGYAWVQFCITDGMEKLFLSQSGFVKIA